MDGEDILASSAFIPLPFRALALVGVGLLCWATNLHILHLLGIDVATVLETRSQKIPLSTPSSPPHGSPSESPIPLAPAYSPHTIASSSSSTALYPAIYRLFVIYAAWVLITYVAFKMAINGDMRLMNRSRGIVTLASVGVVVGLFCPFNILQKRERDTFMV